MATDLARFHERHDQGWQSIALKELRAGRKRSHWIWWIFPQLEGLGRSPISVKYALADVDEARDYLQDAVLRDRLAEAIDTVAESLARGVLLVELMGGGVDAAKLMSCLTLFSGVADPSVQAQAQLAQRAETVLRRAEQAGLRRCAYTQLVLDDTL